MLTGVSSHVIHGCYPRYPAFIVVIRPLSLLSGRSPFHPSVILVIRLYPLLSRCYPLISCCDPQIFCCHPAVILRYPAVYLLLSLLSGCYPCRHVIRCTKFPPVSTPSVQSLPSSHLNLSVSPSPGVRMIRGTPL